MKNFLTKASIAIILILIAIISFSTYKEFSKKKKIQAEINKLQEEARKINKENLDIQERVAYFESRDFQEKEAKEKLNLQKPGENIVVVKPSILGESQEPQKDSKEPPKREKVDNIPIPVKWFRYLFGKF